MCEPRVFRARQILVQVGRPMLTCEVAPLLGASNKQASNALTQLCTAGLARRVVVPGRTRMCYEAVA